MSDYEQIERAIRDLPDPDEINVRRPLETFNDAGGDMNHPICKRLQKARDELEDSINETISLMEDLQHDLANPEQYSDEDMDAIRGAKDGWVAA